MKEALPAKKQACSRPLPHHLVLRVPLRTHIDGRTFDTVEAHNKVVDKIGRVALAKFGNPGTLARVETLKAQIEQGVETFLVLVVKQNNRFFGYQAGLTSVHYGAPDRKIIRIAPPYYSDLGLSADLWFTVASPFVACALRDFRLSTNHRPLLDVIRECRTASMLVEKAR